MPRPSHPALTGGSVLVYQGVRLDPVRLKELRWQGIGTRRAEGFGRVAVQWHGARRPALSRKPWSSPSIGITRARPSPELVTLQRNLLCNALKGILIARAVADAGRVGRPSAALVARLRGRVRTTTPARGIRDFLARASLRPEDKGLKKAGQALARARLGQKPLSNWVTDWMLGTEWDRAAAWLRCVEVTDESRRLGRLAWTFSAKLIAGCSSRPTWMPSARGCAVAPCRRTPPASGVEGLMTAHFLNHREIGRRIAMQGLLDLASPCHLGGGDADASPISRCCATARAGPISPAPP